MFDVYSWDTGMGHYSKDDVARMFARHFDEVQTKGRTETWSRDMAKLLMDVSDRLELGWSLKEETDFDGDELFWISK